MSESPIQLRDKGGRRVFDGTQSPGGGSQPGALRMLGPFTVTDADFSAPDGFNFVAALLYAPTVGDALIGFSWLLRTPFDSNLTACNIAPQTTADSGTAGPALIPSGAVINMGSVQGNGPGNTGGDYFASSFLPIANVNPSTGDVDEPCIVGPVISDGTALYLGGDIGADPPPLTLGQVDIYVYVATPAAA